MNLDRPFQHACILVAAVLLAATIGAKPLYAVDGVNADAKKANHDKKNTKSSKAKKPHGTTIPPIVERDPREQVPGQGY